jgi:hypothetical protein
MGFVSAMNDYIDDIIKNSNPVLDCFVRAIPIGERNNLKENLEGERDILLGEIERIKRELQPLEDRVITYNEAIALLERK